jgi:hypothetical protein
VSGYLMGAAWRVAGLTKAERTVLLALADHASDDGTNARPGIPLIAWKTDYSKRHVVRALQALEDKGLIQATKRGGAGPGDVTEYLLTFENATEKPGSKRVTSGTPFAGAKGDIRSKKRVTSETAKGDISRRASNEPPITTNRQGEPGADEPARPRNVVWDVLVELYGEVPKRGRSARGGIVADLRELLLAEGVRDAETAVAEIRRRHVALARAWPQHTLRIFVEQFPRLASAGPGDGSLTTDDLRALEERLRKEGM